MSPIIGITAVSPLCLLPEMYNVLFDTFVILKLKLSLSENEIKSRASAGTTTKFTGTGSFVAGIDFHGMPA
jgi:hypothetical protein